MILEWHFQRFCLLTCGHSNTSFLFFLFLLWRCFICILLTFWQNFVAPLIVSLSIVSFEFCIVSDLVHIFSPFFSQVLFSLLFDHFVRNCIVELFRRLVVKQDDLVRFHDLIVVEIYFLFQGLFFDQLLFGLVAETVSNRFYYFARGVIFSRLLIQFRENF